MGFFDFLHPSVQHHVVNSLGWRSLRPVQEQCIEPILSGQSLLVLAPTAGGKTEAALFPVLSRMLTENWRGLSVIYVCPLKALLNNLHERVERYCRLLGRSCGVWHGDIPDNQRRAMVNEPPDVLLTTPESLEVMLIFRSRKHPRLLADVRLVVVDELHAFASDDRGWHLSCVLSRIEYLNQRPLQRIGLSATIGNPAELLTWYAPNRPSLVVDATVKTGPIPDIQVDYVGSYDNAARVIGALHQGEKRLAFCDSRSGVEELARSLRQLGVDTFVSHSSLSLEQRKQAEAAFAARSNCVIVSTSTLELGIDVGDLDRVIQIDAPATVSSFLQRIGRTGRRSGTTRNCLFLATTHDALLRAAGLVDLWSSGFVEPVTPPREPWHIFAQQLMALSLQRGGIETHDWEKWLSQVDGIGNGQITSPLEVVDHMLNSTILTRIGGLLSVGEAGEDEFGRKNFMDLLSSFTSEPLVRIQHGQNEIGVVDPISLTSNNDDGARPVLLLGGRGWQVTHVDWDARVAYVTPTEARGRSRWLGKGPGLSYQFCQSIRRVLSHDQPDPRWSARACLSMDQLRGDHSWIRTDATVLLSAGDDTHWYTFGGLRANAAIAQAFIDLGVKAQADNLSVVIRESTSRCEGGLLDEVCARAPQVLPMERAALLASGLKFNACLPQGTAELIVAHRMLDREAVQAVLRERRVSVT